LWRWWWGSGERERRERERGVSTAQTVVSGEGGDCVPSARGVGGRYSADCTAEQSGVQGASFTVQGSRVYNSKLKI